MTCKDHRPRPVGPPRLQPSGYVDTVLRCEACGWVGVKSEWREAKAEPQQLALALGEVEENA